MGTCFPACPPYPGPPVIQGNPGVPGVNGTNGSNGINAFCVTSAGFAMPASSANVNVSVTNALWMVPGQTVFCQFAGVMQVVAVLSAVLVTLQNLGYSGNATVGTSIPSASQISPSGPVGGSTGAGAGLTSVGLTVPAALAVTPGTLTSNGTFALSWQTGQTSASFLATPTSTTGAVSLRKIAAGDLPGTATLQSNTFNGTSQLVQTTSSGLLPALNGSLLTNLNASNLGSGTIPDARLDATVATATNIPAAYRQAPVIQANSPATGATVTFGTYTSDVHLYLTPAGTIASLTIAFPSDANSFLNQELWIHSTQTITALTVSGSGATIYGPAVSTYAPSTAASIGFRKLAANTWFRII